MACVINSIDAYLQYSPFESHPRIVVLLDSNRHPMLHWCYMSDQRVVVPPFFINKKFIEGYNGILKDADPRIQDIFNEGRYRVSSSEMNLVKVITTM
jgi:hypothetical protein